MKKVCLSLDDFSVSYPRFDLLLSLKKYFPNFKISLFTIPFHEKKDWGPSVLRNDNLKEIKKNLDWIQLIPHGFEHHGSEMSKMSYDEFALKCLLIQDAFEDDGLPYERGFKAPHWRWNENVVRVLDEIGWWGAVTPAKDMPKTKMFYEYNYAIDEHFWESDKDVLKLHGHLWGTKNDIGLCFNNITKLPKDIEWCYITDFIETK